MDNTMEHVKCDLCGADGNVLIFSRRDFRKPDDQREFNIVRCRSCELMYTNPRPTEKEIGAYYPNEYYRYGKPKKRNKLQHLIRLLREKIKRHLMVEFYGYPNRSQGGLSNTYLKFLKKSLLYPVYIRLVLTGKDTGIIPFHGTGKILEVGCGSGQRLASLREHGWEIYGVEVSHLATEFAKNNFGLEIITGNLHQANFKENFFDAVLFRHSLEHMHSPMKILKEINRILKDDGLVKIVLPNAGSVEAKLLGKWWSPWDVPRHLYHFTPRTIKEILKKNGFEVTKISYDFGTTRILGSINCLLKDQYNMQLKQSILLSIILTPFMFISGYLWQNGEMTIYAEKQADVK